MAEIQTADSGARKKGEGKVRAKKLSTRVDLTPMVDLAFLLITFFMLTTTLAKPQIMPVVMPEKKITEEDVVETKESQVLTLLLGGNDRSITTRALPTPSWTLRIIRQRPSQGYTGQKSASRGVGRY
jgi:Biopolymer transport protein ExbD/TolR.